MTIHLRSIGGKNIMLDVNYVIECGNILYYSNRISVHEGIRNAVAKRYGEKAVSCKIAYVDEDVIRYRVITPVSEFSVIYRDRDTSAKYIYMQAGVSEDMPLSYAIMRYNTRDMEYIAGIDEDTYRV